MNIQTLNFNTFKTKFKHNNKKINFDIEKFIIDSIDNNNFIIKNTPIDDDKLNELKINLKNKIDNVEINKFISSDEMSIYLNSKPYKG